MLENNISLFYSEKIIAAPEKRNYNNNVLFTCRYGEHVYELNIQLLTFSKCYCYFSSECNLKNNTE